MAYKTFPLFYLELFKLLEWRKKKKKETLSGKKQGFVWFQATLGWEPAKGQRAKKNGPRQEGEK